MIDELKTNNEAMPDFDRVWLQTLAEDSRMISYRPTFRKITGSVTAAILLQQILYRWSNNGCRPFYKYKEVCDADDYRPGDSWCEELAFSRDEFDSALKRIAQKVSRKVPKDTNALVWYWTMQDRKTWYELNYSALRKAAFPIYVERESHDKKTGKAALDLLYTEITTKNTTKKKKINNNIDPVAPVVVVDSFSTSSKEENLKSKNSPEDDAALRKRASIQVMRTLIMEVETILPIQWIGLATYLETLTMKTTYELCKWFWAWQVLKTSPSSVSGGLYDPGLYERYEKAKQLYGPTFDNARSLPARIKAHMKKEEYLELAPDDEDDLKVILRDRTDDLIKQGSEHEPQEKHEL